MNDAIESQDGDRLIVHFDPGGPVELAGLTDSFSALARIYERHFRKDKDDSSPKLYITKLSTGSIIAEIAPYVSMFGDAYAIMSSTNTVGDFSKRISDGLRAFAGFTPAPTAISPVEPKDAADLRTFIEPLTGKAGATLGLKHARYHSRDGSRETIIEYDFDSPTLDRAALNIDRALTAISETPDKSFKSYDEVMLFFDAASREAGKEVGRTKDYAVVPEISKKALPTYFRKSVSGNLKDVMVRGSQNPLADVAFVVDLHAQVVDGEPKGYIVTNVHKPTLMLEHDTGSSNKAK